jgi:hypothetical protein
LSTHSENIWQRNSARQIMQEGRARVKKTLGTKNEVPARIQLASDEYALWKRYFSPLGLPLLVWHVVGSCWQVRKAIDLAWTWGYPLNPDQIDVLSTILRKAPKPLKDLQSAAILLESGLMNPHAFDMKPHTKAFLWIGTAEVEIARGLSPERAETFYQKVAEIRPAITDKRQASRVDSAIAFYYLGLKNSDQVRVSIGTAALKSAFQLAREESRDQLLKLIAECKKRNISIPS